ncbi:MAG: GTPase HflX [Candidatus Omnitrophica bacterium]|nr:GTPase HflX [Candidatus Omnitrophota bacterium]MCM8790679.1 GTPase HflX [Candidatus Omnitrophota bacterium]
MERALLVTVDSGRDEGWSAEERSTELAELAMSAGAKVVRQEIVRRHELNPACFIGSGKARQFAKTCADENIDIVIFNNELSASQQKNLESIMRTKTIDRTQLILDIFARRAHTNEGKLQVELAQLSYMLPRLTGKGVAMSRLGGGIGTRGPGEQKLEYDRRRIRARISHLKKDLESLHKRRDMMRKKRSRFSVLTVAIIGYTNVGKSTLLNALTDSDVMVYDKLFATLDPTVRKFTMPNNQKVLFVDTVGFIKELPHHLVEAFKATLEEVIEADLLLHLVDASHPKALEQAEAVYKVLGQIGAEEKPTITALNKIDLVENAEAVNRLRSHFNDAIMISALKRRGFDILITHIMNRIKGATMVVKLKIPAADARTLNLIHENGFIRHQEYEGDCIYIEAEISIRLKDLLKGHILSQ